MSRPLASLLALAIAGILALLVFVSRSLPEVATPPVEAGAHVAVRAQERVELAGALEQLAPLSVPERQPIASRPDTPSEVRARFFEPTGSQELDAVIEGRVVCAEGGLPIPGAQVELEFGGSAFDNIRSSLPPGLQRARPLVARDGTFRCTGLAHGVWTVTAESPGRKSRSERVKTHANAPAVTVLALEQQRVVRVRLVDASGQLATAESLGVDGWMADLVCVAVGPACAGAGTAFQNVGDLTYRARGSGGGVLSWSVEINGGGPICLHVLRGDTVLSTRELHGESEVDVLVTAQDLARDLARCDARVVDEVLGDPIADAVVRFRPKLGKPREARSDADGRASANPLPAGEITVEASAPGFTVVRQVAQIPLSEPLVLRLNRGRRIEGIVLDLSGVPVESLRVFVQPSDEFGRLRPGQSPRSVPTDRAGRFAFDALSPQTYVVSVPERLANVSDPLPGDAQSTGKKSTTILAEPAPTQRVDLRPGDAFGIVLRVTRNAF